MLIVCEDDFVDQIEGYLEFFDINPSNVSFLLAPQTDDESDTVNIICNIRIVSSEKAGKYELDAVYTFNEPSSEVIIEDIYPAIIEQFQQKFSKSRITSYLPK